MKLIKPSYEILTPIKGEEILKTIEIAARTCYKSEGKIGSVECPHKELIHNESNEYIYPHNCVKYKRSSDGVNNCPYNNECWKYNNIQGTNSRVIPSYFPLLHKLIARGHEAMLEFGGMITVKFICDRGVSHELVRHRLCSFAQESTRYCNYGKDEHISFIIPEWLTLEEGIIPELKQWDYSVNAVEIDSYISYDIGTQEYWQHFQWMYSMLQSEAMHNDLIIGFNWSPQQARSVLPNSLKTEINVSTNIRDWRHIFQLRTAKAAHPQMRELMCPLLDEFKKKIPILFDDINY